MQQRREKTYDYDTWLEQGYYLFDYDFATKEYILMPLSNIKVISRSEASGN